MNHYHTLGVRPDAEHEEIKAAYRALASQWHPDKHHCSMESTTMMQKINQAYAILGNPEKRSRYDYDHGFGTFAQQAKKPHFKSKNDEFSQKTPPNGPKQAKKNKYHQPPRRSFNPGLPCPTCHGLGSIRVAALLGTQIIQCPRCEGWGSC